ncbi:MAG: hypothetical protein JWP57_4649, partial [Spirosoma sp.]|nr:hypothetical protein [Spirosoma sp.]
MNEMRFFVGLHQPSDAQHFPQCFVSVNRLWKRRSDFAVADWIMDSGAFTELRDYGCYRPERSVENYAAQIRRWKSCGNLLAACAQDWMCEEIIIEGGMVRGTRFVGTGLSVEEHQRLTIER